MGGTQVFLILTILTFQLDTSLRVGGRLCRTFSSIAPPTPSYDIKNVSRHCHQFLGHTVTPSWELLLQTPRAMSECLSTRDERQQNYLLSLVTWRFSGGSDSKESACNAGDMSLILRSGRPPDGGGNLLQYSGLENPMDRGAWQATVHGVPKSWTQLKMYASRK